MIAGHSLVGETVSPRYAARVFRASGERYRFRSLAGTGRRVVRLTALTAEEMTTDGRQARPGR